jgi:dihydroorotase
MLRALQYTQIFGAKVFTHAEDLNLSTGGRMHEGNTSVLLGLKGIPSITEELAIKRDIELAKYTNSSIHFSHISSKVSVEIIQKAKKKGLPITCDVAIANLCYTDTDLVDYNSNLKLNPPLRCKEDRKALWNGLIDGTIDAIVTDHLPQNALPLIVANAPNNFDTNLLVQKLSTNPRTIINKPIPVFEKGQVADFIIFDSNKKWILNDKTNFSKSRNSVVYNKELQGKVIATYYKNNIQTF